MARSVAVLAILLFALSAHADPVNVSIEAGTERDKFDLSHPLLFHNIFSIGQNLESGYTWSLSAQNFRFAHDGPEAWAVEGLAGYRHRYSNVVTIYVAAGPGVRALGARDIPFVTLRGGIDDEVDERLTWNTLNLRFRAGLNFSEAFYSSIVGTGLTYRLTDDLSLYTRIFGVFDTDFHFVGTGIAIGARKSFL